MSRLYSISEARVLADGWAAGAVANDMMRKTREQKTRDRAENSAGMVAIILMNAVCGNSTTLAETATFLVIKFWQIMAAPFIGRPIVQFRRADGQINSSGPGVFLLSVTFVATFKVWPCQSCAIFSGNPVKAEPGRFRQHHNKMQSGLEPGFARKTRMKSLGKTG